MEVADQSLFKQGPVVTSFKQPWIHSLFCFSKLTRTSNLPTCVSNVLVGTAAVSLPGSTRPWHLSIALTATVLFYVAGMAMNDAVDADVDRQLGLDRPIPTGQVTTKQAWLLTALALLLGLGLLSAAGLAAIGVGVALVATIVVYNLTHKKTAASVLAMGLCRGLVYLLAAVVVAPHSWLSHTSTLVLLVVILSLYTMAVTLTARTENKQTPSTGVRLMFALGLLPATAAFWMQPNRPLLSLVAFVFMTIWLLRGAMLAVAVPAQTKQAVMVWISGMCLVDAFLLTLLDRPVYFGIALACFVASAWAHRRISGS